MSEIKEGDLVTLKCKSDYEAVVGQIHKDDGMATCISAPFQNMPSQHTLPLAALKPLKLKTLKEKTNESNRKNST